MEFIHLLQKYLPLDENNATNLLVQGNTTNDIIQTERGSFTGSVVLQQLSDSLITATDGDTKVVKRTANDVRTNNRGITKKQNKNNYGNLFSVIDETTLGGTTLDPAIVAAIPMTCTSVSCTSLTFAGVPVTGGISARIANLVDLSLYHNGGMVKYKLPSFLS
jgi:hypothetical protein